MLSHRIRPVSEILAPHVEHLWVVRGYLAARWRNMILPDGAMELIVNLGDPQKLCAQDSPAKHTIFRHSWISGERTTPIVIDEIGYVHLVGVRLRAGGAWPPPVADRGPHSQMTESAKQELRSVATPLCGVSAPPIALREHKPIRLQRMRSRVNDMISAPQRMAYTRRSNGQAFKLVTGRIRPIGRLATQ